MSKILAISLILLLPTFSLASDLNSDEWIIDKFPGFQINWSMVLMSNDGKNLKTTKLSNHDIKEDEKYSAKLSDAHAKRFCKFNRSLRGKVIKATESESYLGHLSCSFSDLKIELEPVVCHYKLKGPVDNSHTSSFKAHINGKELYFIYGCNLLVNPK